MASSAFKQRFKTACSTCASSPRINAVGSASRVSTRMPFLPVRVTNNCTSRTTVLRENDSRPRAALSGEAEQVARQLGSAIAGEGNVFEILKRATIAHQFMTQREGRAHDRVERVVDVVRDTSREPSNRLDLLCLVQGFFHRSTLLDEMTQALSPPAHRDGHEQRDQRLWDALLRRTSRNE